VAVVAAPGVVVIHIAVVPYQVSVDPSLFTRVAAALQVAEEAAAGGTDTVGAHLRRDRRHRLDQVEKGGGHQGEPSAVQAQL